MAKSLEEMKNLIGQEIGVSDWVEVTQDKINMFAYVTGDHQYIHVDEERAAQTPFGGTIAHGFLVLSLMPKLSEGHVMDIDGVQMVLNYGCDRLRFMAPVRSGKKVRLRSKLKEITEKTPEKLLMKTELTFEIEGEDKPAIIADWLMMAIL